MNLQQAEIQCEKYLLEIVLGGLFFSKTGRISSFTNFNNIFWLSFNYLLALHILNQQILNLILWNC